MVWIISNVSSDGVHEKNFWENSLKKVEKFSKSTKESKSRTDIYGVNKESNTLSSVLLLNISKWINFLIYKINLTDYSATNTENQ